MAPYVGRGSYINDVDPILAASPLWPSAYYGDNLAKYIAAKTRWMTVYLFGNEEASFFIMRTLP
jgi:hypothetical protein